jgi:hypothetical protein
LLENCHSTFELHLFDLVGCLKDLFCLRLCYTLDAQHFFLGDHQTGEHGAESMSLELVDVSTVDAMILKEIQFLEGSYFILLHF